MTEIIYHGKYERKQVGFQCETCGCHFKVDAGNEGIEWTVTVSEDHIAHHVRFCRCPECRAFCYEI